MKKIYCLKLDGDWGELWLDENKKVIEYIHANDATFDSYHHFIIEYFGGQLVAKNIDRFNGDKFCEIAGDFDEMAEFFKKEIKKLK